MADSSERTKKQRGPGKPFVKGICPNPAGRPKLPDSIKDAFKALAPESIEVLRQIMQNKEARDGDRLRAAEIILNRGYGTPVQSIELSNKDGDPFGVMSLTYEQAVEKLKELRADNE